MTYSIKELVRASGETKRNIRWYAQEGLLPKPGRAGREAVYSEEHLRLLREIRRLQAAGCTLRQVRERLVSPSMRRNQREPASLRASSVPRYGAPGEFKQASLTAGAGGGDEPHLQLWRRVAITPDIELHVRGRSARTAARLERVLRQALGEETRE